MTSRVMSVGLSCYNVDEAVLQSKPDGMVELVVA